MKISEGRFYHEYVVQINTGTDIHEDVIRAALQSQLDEAANKIRALFHIPELTVTVRDKLT